MRCFRLCLLFLCACAALAARPKVPPLPPVAADPALGKPLVYDDTFPKFVQDNLSYLIEIGLIDTAS
jgi:hypothetical protein